MIKFAWVVLLVSAGWASSARADSPLGELYQVAVAYRDIPEVKEVARGSGLTPAALAFVGGLAPTDQKLALVAAIELEEGSDAVTQALVKGLASQRGKTPKTLAVEDLKPEDLFVLGVVLARETGAGPRPLGVGAPSLSKLTAQDLLAAAAAAMPNDFTVNYMQAIVSAQASFEDFCGVYKLTAEVTARFDPAKRNLRPTAFDPLNAYLGGYAKYCSDTAEGKAEQLDGLNQVYKVLRVGARILTATQSGAVLWDPARPEAPVLVELAGICSHAVARDGQAWIGCQSKLLHYDGERLRVVTSAPSAASDEPYPWMPVLGPSEVRVYRGPEAWRVGSAGLEPLPASAEAGGYDVLITGDGVVWWIDFMDAVHSSAQGAFPTRSDKYPGRDPRAFVLKGQTLHVMDFEDGVFYFDTASGRFVNVPFPYKQLVDLSGDWLLRYRQGPVRVSTKPGEAPLEVDLASLGYMRDLHMDPDGALWVAGWGALALVMPDLKVQLYKVTKIP